MALCDDLDALRNSLDDPDAQRRVRGIVRRAADEVIGALFGSFLEDRYRGFLREDDLTAEEQNRLAFHLRNDAVFGRVRARLLPQVKTLAPTPGLADELTVALNREQVADFERALHDLAACYNRATEDGVTFTPRVTDDERRAFVLLRFNGHTTAQHVEFAVQQLWFHLEGDVLTAFAIGKSFSPALADMRKRVARRFATLADQVSTILFNNTTQAANVAQRQVNEALASIGERHA